MNVQKSDKKRNNYDLIAMNFIKVTNFGLQSKKLIWPNLLTKHF